MGKEDGALIAKGRGITIQNYEDGGGIVNT